MNNIKIEFYRGLRSNYLSNTNSSVNNGIFFASDTKELFVGKKSYSGLTDVIFENNVFTFKGHNINADKTYGQDVNSITINLNDKLLSANQKNVLNNIDKILSERVTYSSKIANDVTTTSAVGAIAAGTTAEELKGKSFTEGISIYGISENSKYVDADITGDKVYISSGYADKYMLNKGDSITLKEEFGDKQYTLKIDGIYKNPTTLAVFLSREKFNDMFDKSDDYYSGYFSNTGIDDIDSNLIATELTEKDYTKSSRQLRQSMGSMMSVFWILGVAVFMLIIYLLAKIIIEKNAQSISITKILGYQKKEINQIYIHTTTIVTIVSLIAVLPIIYVLLNWVWHIMMTRFTGWIPCVVQWDVYLKVIIIGIVTYAVVAVLLMRKTNKIPLGDALKNVE